MGALDYRFSRGLDEGCMSKHWAVVLNEHLFHSMIQAGQVCQEGQRFWVVKEKPWALEHEASHLARVSGVHYGVKCSGCRARAGCRVKDVGYRYEVRVWDAEKRPRVSGWVG